MRAIYLVTILAGPLVAQDVTRGQDIPAGTRTARVTLTLNEAPRPGDRFVADISTDKIKAVLITPGGLRITEANASSAGMEWTSDPFTPALGTTDGGHALVVDFAMPGKAGSYVFEFDAGAATSRSRVNIRFISEKREYDAMMRSLPGFKMAGPVALGSKRPETLNFTLAQEEKVGIFDVVVTDPSAKVGFTLPGGRVIETADGQDQGLDWKTVKKAEDIDGADSSFGIGGFLLHRDGTHHVFIFESAPQGRYEVLARTSETKPVELTAAFIPLGRALEDAVQSLGKLGDAPPGQVRLQPYALPYDCYVGDSVDLMVGLTGDPVVEPVNFKVQLEYRTQLGQDSQGATQWSEPVVEDTNIVLTRTPEGLYTGKLTPARPGRLRVGIQVSGKSTKGKAFSEQIPVGEMNVHRVAARLGSLTEQAIPKNGSDKLERLEITAHLDVVLPGPYEMRLSIDDAHSSLGMLASGTGVLAAGGQTLTISIPAEDIRKKLKDGPWTIRGVQIFRPEGNSFGDFVGAGVAGSREPTLTTAAYRRDQWDQGDAFTDEQATAHGVYPTSSGLFRMVEVDWGVTTPGGQCSWSASLGMDAYQSRNVISSGVLPNGRTVLSFVFDGAMVTGAPSAKWYFSSLIDCESVKFADDHAQPLISVTLDPTQFEAAPPFFVDSQEILRLRAGEERGFLAIDVYGKKREDVSVRVGDPVPGITVTGPAFRGDVGWAAQYGGFLKVDSNVMPARYFVPILAASGSETSQTALVVDVVP